MLIDLFMYLCHLLPLFLLWPSPKGITNWETHEDSVCSQVISCKHRQASFDVHSGKDPRVPPADDVEDRQRLVCFTAILCLQIPPNTDLNDLNVFRDWDKGMATMAPSFSWGLLQVSMQAPISLIILNKMKCLSELGGHHLVSNLDFDQKETIPKETCPCLWTHSHAFAIFCHCLCCGHHPRDMKLGDSWRFSLFAGDLMQTSSSELWCSFWKGSPSAAGRRRGGQTMAHVFHGNTLLADRFKDIYVDIEYPQVRGI